MGIGDQFAGLPMENLIGGPLTAAAKAGKEMAAVTADFINTIGFDKDGNLRTAAFMYERRSANEDGTTNSDSMKVDVPMLAITPIPNLQVDEVNVMFDMEVKQSEQSESSTDLSATASGTLNLGIVKVSISGSVSSHSSNTRSSDNSAKYHVDVRATNHGTPEGLARVLDMMASAICPTLVSSTPKDADGQDLPAAAKARAERIKALRTDKMQLENSLSAAQKSLGSTLAQMKRTASSQQKAYQLVITQEMNKLNLDDKDEAKKKEASEKHDEYSEILQTLDSSWNEFQSGLADNIKRITSAGEAENGLSKVFSLKGLKKTGTVGEPPAFEVVDYEAATEKGQLAALTADQKNAVSAQSAVNELEQKILQKDQEYNNAISSRDVPQIDDKKKKEEKTPANPPG